MKNKIQLVVVLGLVIDQYGRCLLTRRREPSNAVIHNRLEFPGGKVEFGEHPSQTAEREVWEETGVLVKAKRMLPVTFVAVRDLESVQINPIIICYVCDIISLAIEPFILPRKISEIQWSPIENIGHHELQDGSQYFFDVFKMGVYDFL